MFKSIWHGWFGFNSLSCLWLFRQATLQEQEAAFRKKELKLVRERQDAMESLNTSTNQEARPISACWGAWEEEDEVALILIWYGFLDMTWHDMFFCWGLSTGTCHDCPCDLTARSWKLCYRSWRPSLQSFPSKSRFWQKKIFSSKVRPFCCPWTTGCWWKWLQPCASELEMIYMLMRILPLNSEHTRLDVRYGSVSCLD